MDVLDIGCNAGHLTLLLARDHHPRKIVGVDIDPVLIQYAQKNIRLVDKGPFDIDPYLGLPTDF